MSDFNGLIAISFLGVAGLFLNFYMARLANILGTQIATGVTDGHLIPIQHRWFMLYNMWVSYIVGGVAGSVFLAFALQRMAGQVGDANVKLLAYMGASLAALGAVSWLVQGLSSFLHYRSLVREAERD